MSHLPYRDPNRKFKSLPVAGMSHGLCSVCGFDSHSYPLVASQVLINEHSPRWPQNGPVLPDLGQLGQVPNSALSLLPFGFSDSNPKSCGPPWLPHFTGALILPFRVLLPLLASFLFIDS